MIKGFSPLNPMNTEFDFFFGPDFFHWPEKSLELEAGRICKVEQDQDEYNFSFNIPGIDRKEVSIDVAANTLIIRGKRKARKTAMTYFERFFLVPEDADIERIEAKIAGCNLTLKMPKCSGSSWNDIEANQIRERQLS